MRGVYLGGYLAFWLTLRRSGLKFVILAYITSFSRRRESSRGTSLRWHDGESTRGTSPSLRWGDVPSLARRSAAGVMVLR